MSRPRRFAALAVLTALLVTLPGCGRQTVQESAQVLTMDTVMTLTVYGTDKAACQAVLRDGEDMLYDWNRHLSATESADSDVYALNHAEGRPVPLGEDTAQLLGRALDLCALTDGALDVTAYSAVEAWGFTGNNDYRVPSQAELDALAAKIDYTRVTLDRDSGQASLPDGMELDLGAVAKGWAGDLLARLVRETDGVDGALLNLGQSTIQTVGARPDGSAWRIGIQDPLGEGTALAELKQQQAARTGDASQAPAVQTEQGSYLGVLELTDRAMSTSGGYQRCFVQDDEIYWHILDPKTAAPARSGLASVTVVADSGLLCDGLSTALFVMGLDRGVQFWQTWRDHKDVSFDCIFITDDGSVYLTPGLADGFTLADGQSREVTVLS